MDVLTQAVLDFQAGRVTLDSIRNQVMVEAFHHLNRCGRKGEDDISDFLLEFHGRIERLVGRFECQGLPFRHYLLRTLRWQWNTFRTERSRERRRAFLAADNGWGLEEPSVSEPHWDAERIPDLTPSAQRRLVLLALKAAPELGDDQLEAISQRTGVELSWLQACQHRLKALTLRRRSRREQLVQKRGEAYYRRLLAEDDARREFDPERREAHEKRAGLYRSRLRSLTKQQEVVSTSPTHLELASLLGMPKGSVDSGLYHLKRELSHVYITGHDTARGHQQRAQKTRT